MSSRAWERGLAAVVATMVTFQWVEVGGEESDVGGAVAAGFAAALEYDRAPGYDPLLDLARGEGQ